jgi:GNAT superfamily N-acetyltransferase
MLPFAQAGALDQILAHGGFEFEAETSVQTCALDSLGDLARGEAGAVEVSPDKWLDDYVRLSAVAADDRNRLQAITEHIAPPTCYMLLCHQGQVVTCGMGMVEGGYVGIFSLVTAPELRGRGYGRQLMGAIARWALMRGAHRAYLQGMPENKAASLLYCKLGFTERYLYWYRVGPQA